MFFLTSRFHQSRVAFKFLLFGLILSACAESIPRPAVVSGPVQAHSPLGAYLASTAAAAIGDYAAAADLARQALVADPEDIDLLRRLFIFLVSEGRIEQSVQLAQRLALKDPNFLPAPLVLAFVEVEAGQAAAAGKRLALFPLSDIDNLLLPLVKAWIAVAEGKWEAAQAALSPFAGSSPFANLYDYHMVLISARKGKLDECETAIELLLRADESLPLRIVELAGLLYETKGLTEKAKNIYDSYRSYNPDTPYLSQAYRRLADKLPPPRLALTDREGLAEALFDVAYLLQQDPQSLEGALFYTRLILQLRPDFPAAQMLLAEILEAQNRSDAALQIYLSIHSESPFHWVARLRAAENRDILGDTEGALADLRQMALERPERYDALANAGDLLRRHDRFAEAVTLYDRALARVSQIERRHASLLFNRGIALERSGQIELAVKDLEEALALEPENPYILNYLGYTWIDRGKNIEPGRWMLEKAATLRPRDGAILDSLGWAFYRLDDLPNAVLWLERAIELKPADPTVNDHLGDAYWRSNRKREAHFQWERALKLGPEPHEIPRIKKKLDQGL